MDIKDIIRQKIDFPQFIQEYANVELRHSGTGWRCACPIHGSDNPSSMLIDNKGMYYCFSCNSSGDVINFVADYDHISYSMAIEKLANMLNISLVDDKEYQDGKALEAKMEVKKQKGVQGRDSVIKYLTEKRGFTEETVKTFELGGYEGKVTIPLIDPNGRTVGMAVRKFDGNPKYINSRNNILFDKSAFLYGLDKARRLIKDSVYVVEGYMDAISGYQMGLPTVAYCSNEIHRDQIRALNKYLRKETSIVIFPDNDEPGKKRLPRVRDYFRSIDSGRQVRVGLVPDEYKDMNDLLLAGIDPKTLPTEHIDKYVIKWLLNGCTTVEEEYQKAESYLPTVHSEMIRLDIIKFLARKWNKDVEDLKKYFNTVGQDSDDILKEASDITGCLNDLRQIYTTGGFKTHFEQIDNCIRRVEKKQVVVIGAYSGVGKALTLDSLIATPFGFVKMGDIKVGDIVFDEDGKETKVTHVFPQGEKDVYRVTFKDGSYVDCCEDHLWKFSTQNRIMKGKSWLVKPLKDIMSEYKLKRGTAGRQGWNLYIPVCSEVNYKKREHIISPYVIGLMLGDGGLSQRQITFTNPEVDIQEKLSYLTASFGHWHLHKGQPNQMCFCGGKNNPFVNYLRETFHGAKSCEKFIPDEYLFDSIENRIELVRGLIDTDGCVNDRGFTQFSSKSKRLIDGLNTLLNSLGVRCEMHYHVRKGKSSIPEYTLVIQKISDVWFSSKNHIERWNKRRNISRRVDRSKMAIVSIEKLKEKKEMQCITVDSPKHTYLCNNYIVTHNTDFAIEAMLRAICQDKMRVVFFSLEMPKGKLIERCVAKLIGCSMEEVEGYIRSSDTQVQNIISKLQNHLLIFDNNNYTINDIEKRIRLVNAKNLMGAPVDMVFVDYFGYLKGTSDFEGASASATKMKAIAKENNIIFVMLSQLNRGGNPYGEPNMTQLKLTGDLEASADIIMLLWRPGKDPNLSLEEKQQLENVTRIKIDKARDGMYGPNIAEFTYNKDTSRLEENYM